VLDFPTGAELVTDLSAAAWVEERLAVWPKTPSFPIGIAIPAGFDAYARIFHPIRRERGGEEEPQRWADFAAERGKVAHAGMQFESLIDTVDWQGERWGSTAPEWGGLPEDECLALCRLLRSRTDTPDTCWFCLWDGYGLRFWVDDRVWVHLPTRGDRRALMSPTSAAREEDRADRLVGVPRVRTGWRGVGRDQGPGREYFLFRGPVDAVGTFHFDTDRRSFQSPNIWWPDDRAWCVGTEVDGFTSFIGGSQGVVDAVIGASNLEALPIDPEDRYDIWGDTVNGPPPDLHTGQT
jgi:hypothetical protein